MVIVLRFGLVDDEEKLNDMSIACEGKVKNEVASSGGSMLSSVSAPPMTGPKFGAQDPATVSKLMSLSEKSRPVNSKHTQQVGGAGWKSSK